jgi:hypothetical protein
MLYVLCATTKTNSAQPRQKQKNDKKNNKGEKANELWTGGSIAHLSPYHHPEEGGRRLKQENTVSPKQQKPAKQEKRSLPDHNNKNRSGKNKKNIISHITRKTTVQRMREGNLPLPLFVFHQVTPRKPNQQTDFFRSPCCKNCRFAVNLL